MRPHWLVPVLLFLIAGCSTTAGTGKPEDLLDVHEAAIRYQMKNSVAVDGPAVPVHVLVDGNDPSGELLRRFSDSPFDLQPGTKRNPAKSVCVSVDNLKWIDRNTVEVEISCNSNGIDGSVHLFRLERQRGKWVVTKDTITAIS